MLENLHADSIIKYSIKWSDDEGINKVEHKKYIDEFSQNFYVRIKGLIDRALSKQKVLPHNK